MTDLAASAMTEIEHRAEIRQRQQIEDALRESEMCYRSVVTAMHEGVVLQDAK